MVAWDFCEKCNRVVDEFESQCFYCKDKGTAQAIKRFLRSFVPKKATTVADTGPSTNGKSSL